MKVSKISGRAGSNGYDRQEVIEQLEAVLKDMGLGLPDEEIHTIAEKFVDLYLSHFEEAYTDIEKPITA